MKRVILSIILLLNIVCGFSQPLLSYTKYVDIPKSGYYSNALTCSDKDGDNTWVVLQIDSTSSKKYQHVLRLDIAGNIIFSKELYTQGYPYSVISTEDDGLLMVGSIQKGSKWAGWCCKLNSAGEVEWNSRYYNTAFNIYYHDVSVAPNGDYVPYGTMHYTKLNGLISRISPTGDMIWTKEYFNTIIGAHIRVVKLLPLETGNMMASMREGETNAFFIKINENGDILYQKSYFLNTMNNFLLSDFGRLEHNNRYVGLFTKTGNASLAIMDSNGVILRNFPTNGFYEKILHIKNNQYIYAKETSGYACISQLDTSGNLYSRMPNTLNSFGSVSAKNTNNAILVYPKSDKRVYFTKLNIEDVVDTTCYNTVNNIPEGLTFKDSTFILNATNYSFFREDVPVTSKTLSFNLTTICSKPNTSIENTIQEQNSILLYPNPAQNWLHILCPYSQYEVRIWDMQGKLTDIILQGKDIPIMYYPQGVYAVQVLSKQGTWSGKFVKLNP